MLKTLQAVGVLIVFLLAFRLLDYLVSRVDWSWSNLIVGSAIGAVVTTAIILRWRDSSPTEYGDGRNGSFKRPDGIEDKDWLRTLAERFDVPAVDMAAIPFDETLIGIVPVEIARKYTVFPVAKKGAKLTVAMKDPTNQFAIDDLRFMTGYSIEPVVTSMDKLLEVIDLAYGSPGTLFEPWITKEPPAQSWDASSKK